MRLLLFIVLNVVFVVIGAAKDSGVSSGFRLHCPNKAMKPVAGQNVTLRCSMDPPVKPDTVEWTVNVNHTCDVYLLRDGKVDLAQQCEEYRGKTSLFPDELSSGNSSLRLMTQLSHSGRYCCSVRVRDPTQNCCIILTVHQRGAHDPLQDNTTENPTAAPPGISTNTAIICVGIIVGISVVIVIVVVVVIVILLIIGVVWCLCKKCNRQQRPKNTTPNKETDDPAQEPMNQSGNGDEIETRLM